MGKSFTAPVRVFFFLNSFVVVVYPINLLSIYSVLLSSFPSLLERLVFLL